LRPNFEYPDEKGFVSGWGDYLKGFKGFSCECVQHVKLPSDMELLYLDMVSLTGIKQVSSIEQAPIIFGFHISGSSRSRIIHSTLRKESVSMEANKVIIGFSPFSSCETLLGEQQRYRFFNIYISPAQLYSQLGGKLNIVPADLKKILEGTFAGPYYIVFNMSPQTRMIIEQIRNCPYRGDLKFLFFEHKSMELILRQFYEIRCAGGPCVAARLRSNDVDLIHEAKRILFENIDNPPALIDLAQQVGINPTKLKKGFRQVFGTTAYTMLRQERILRARDLLDEENLSVAEIGHQLGFSDTSHFIRVFAKHYGVTPGKYTGVPAS